MTESVEMKLVRLEERLHNQIDRVTEIKSDSSREIEQMRKGATENHNSLRLEMDTRFSKVDERFEKLSCEVKVVDEGVKNVSGALQKGLGDIAIMFHTMNATISANKADVEATKEKAKVSWGVITAIGSGVIGAAGLAAFFMQHFKLG
jgi:hypothetical protein